MALSDGDDEFPPCVCGEHEDHPVAILGVTYGDTGRVAYFDALSAAGTRVRAFTPMGVVLFHCSALCSMSASEAAAGKASDWSQRKRTDATLIVAASSQTRPSEMSSMFTLQAPPAISATVNVPWRPTCAPASA